MTNQKYFGELKANARVTYLKNLPAAIELYNYLNTLKEKYGVSFGEVDLDSAIISHTSANNIIYFAGINKHIIPPIFTSYTQLPEGKNDNDFDKEDIKKLTSLQKEFEKFVLENTPPKLDFPEEEILDALKKVRPNPDGKTDLSYLNSCNRFVKSEAYDYFLEKHGFAGNKKHGFKFELYFVYPQIRGDLDFSSTFTVEYKRLFPNKEPHFSTTYDGSQRQESMKKNHPAYEFYKKWNIFHLSALTMQEMNELMEDIKKLGKLHDEYLKNPDKFK